MDTQTREQGGVGKDDDADGVGDQWLSGVVALVAAVAGLRDSDKTVTVVSSLYVHVAIYWQFQLATVGSCVLYYVANVQ